MKNMSSTLLGISAVCLAANPVTFVHAKGMSQMMTSGKAYSDFRLRYESVEQDNALKDADGLTLRSRVGYQTGTYEGFSGILEFEDSRTVLGLADYNNTLGMNTDYSVIADPETTELDQGYLQYQFGSTSVKFGRQVITYDNHRFVGHVGWRQDRQTFDGLTINSQPIEGLKLNYAYLEQRNRIFAEAGDLPAKDHLLNGSYQTPFGTLGAYGYLLEVDEGSNNTLDTFGARFGGSTAGNGFNLIYALEFATQTFESGSTEYDADYLFVEAGAKFGQLTTKLGYEVLGSDDGQFGFQTPLATLHKFNGWADQFLSTPLEGLKNLSITFAAPLAGGNASLVYHDFESDDSTAGVDDLGSEVDLLYARKFCDHYNAGIKYAAYSAGDVKVDTDKLWLWVGASF